MYDFLKGKAEEDSVRLHKSRYNYVLFYLIEMCIGYLCMWTHTHLVDDGDYHTFMAQSLCMVVFMDLSTHER